MAKRPLLKITTEYPDSVSAGVHTLAGKLLGDEDGYGLLEKIKDDVEEGRPHVVLDLAGVEFANSSGMGILASIYNTTKQGQGSLVLVNVGATLRKGLEIILVWDLVGHADTVAEALAGLPSS